ncbi:MAG: hypothetical protein GWP06_14325 [Actinobacteria bacterium]|nr:hypothetical protein [Actinomycetota bacterium]
MKTSRLLYLAISFVVFTSTSLLFSGTTGKVSGRVIDKSTNEGLPSVNVVVEGTAMGAATDPDGYYRIINLSPDSYNLKVTMIGYTPTTVKEIRVYADRTTTQNIRHTISIRSSSGTAQVC